MNPKIEQLRQLKKQAQQGGGEDRLAAQKAKGKLTARERNDALVDPNRYKGPPLQPVHNHGMLANLTLLDIADRLNEPAYRRVAIDRLVNDSTQVFSPQGRVGAQ